MLGKMQPSLKTGQEPLTLNEQPLAFHLLDFWRWSASDIMSNATRGLFAEFIVATATGIPLTSVRDEWGAYDLDTPEGIKIEVKSCAYLQTWHQERLSTVSFGIRETHLWDYNTGKFAAELKRHADVYVFCLLHHKDKQTVDPLNLNQWEFYVLPTSQLNSYTGGKKAISLTALRLLTQAVSYECLHNEIKEKYRQNHP